MNFTIIVQWIAVIAIILLGFLLLVIVVYYIDPEINSRRAEDKIREKQRELAKKSGKPHNNLPRFF